MDEKYRPSKDHERNTMFLGRLAGLVSAAIKFDRIKDPEFIEEFNNIRDLYYDKKEGETG